MASFDSLPEELLYDVFEHVHRTSDGSHDLSIILRVTRRFHRVAKNILYKKPRLLRPDPKDELSWNDRRRHQLSCLLNRLLKEPDLAKKVQKLELCIILERSSQLHTWLSTECPNTKGWPSWEACSALIEELNVGAKSSLGLKFLHSAYSRHLTTGFEPATASLILALVPSLRDLSLNTYVQKKTSGLPRAFQPTSMHFKEWYGRPGIDQSDAIIGLTNLVNLKATELLPWSMMCKPKVRSLEISLPSSIMSSNRIPDVNTMNSQNLCYITTLVVGMRCAYMDEQKMRYVAKLTERLPCLTKLQLGTGGTLKMFERFGGYAITTKRVQAPALQEFIFDPRRLIYHMGSYSPRELAASQASRIISLDKFPDLRRVVGPVGAFLAMGSREVCVLPRSIQSIEIIDKVGEQFPDFFQALADSDDLPNLKSVLVWQICKDRRKHQDIIVSEEVEAWSRCRGIFVGPGQGEFEVSHNTKWR